jgi:hypothetical protein
MNMPASPIKIAEWLGRITHEIGELTEELAQADRDAVVAKAEYDRAYAIAFRQASGSVESRRHTATEVCHGRRLAAEELGARVRAIKARIQHARDRIDVGRSFGAALRAEAAAVNTSWGEG